VDITKEVVKRKVVACQLLGNTSSGGLDAQAIAQQRLLHFGGLTSQQLQQVVARLIGWISNDFKPWVTYITLKARQLVALDKCPVIWPVVLGIGECYNCINIKYTLLV
jgi:hypothetical protein